VRNGDLIQRLIEIETQDMSNAIIDFVGGQRMDEMGVIISDMFGNLLLAKTVLRKIKLSGAQQYLLREENENLLDSELIHHSAKKKQNQPA
jgi:ATP-dependent HslUV protease ATP-binding subunit HslU